MLRFLFLAMMALQLLVFGAEAEENPLVKQTHIHIENGIVYCDVQTFNQEAYILKVLGGGSPLTIFWQFDVLRERAFWSNSSVAVVRLGRQVIPDLVTKRWLMRDLSSGVIRYTSDIHIAMRFLTTMNHAAAVDISLLDQQEKYILETNLYVYEGEREEETSWWSVIMNWGEDMGSVELVIPGKGGKFE